MAGILAVTDSSRSGWVRVGDATPVLYQKRLALTRGGGAGTVLGNTLMKALLLLEDGTLFEGIGFGAEGEAFGEVVFNTSITGYQEILTDPSYRGQIVAMTFPQIGNCGVNGADQESRRTWLSGFVVKELSSITSNWRATGDLGGFSLRGVVGIQGIDTRALTRHLRMNGAKHAVISTRDDDPASLAWELAAAPRIVGIDLVREVTCDQPYEWTEPVAGRPAAARYQQGPAPCRGARLRGEVQHPPAPRERGIQGFRRAGQDRRRRDPRPETRRGVAVQRSRRSRTGYATLSRPSAR